jgi:MOSC domain-containing protein YiiM
MAAQAPAHPAQQSAGTPRVIGICISSAAGTPLHSVSSVRAVAGRGLDGDRYHDENGTFIKNGKPLKPGTQLTLIESEAIEALHREYDVVLDPAHARRNLLTRGVALNHLVGATFFIDDVQVRGVKLCEPCGFLESLTSKAVRQGLVHRGGLRCDVLSDGVIRVGSAVRTSAAALEVCA